jgi:predicted nicotinamide N-methyase
MTNRSPELPERAATSGSVTETPVPGGWSRRAFSVAGRSFQLVQPSEPDHFLEALAALPAEQHDDHDVYWAQLWQAAPPTAARILAHSWPAGAEALEFGCGLGIAGLAALAVGLRVTFSDYVPFAVQTAVENARLNGFEASGEVLDWRRPPERRWPIVFGCDVLYNQAMHEPLVTFLHHVLAPGGTCWIGDAGRFHAGKFLQRAEANGFTTRIENEQGERLAKPHHGQFQLFILDRR